MRSAGERVARAFPDPVDYDRADRYLEWVLAAFSQIVATARRTTTVAAVLVMIFLLFAGETKAEFTLGPAKITNVGTLLVLIPGAVSLLLYEFVVLIFAYARYETVFVALFDRLYPRLASEDLDALVGPPTPSIWGGEESWQGLRGSPGGKLYGFRVLSGIGAMVVLAVACVAFLVLAYLHVHRELDVSATAFWASVGFSVLNVVRMALLGADEFQALRGLF
jgi:hypothetical protein